MSNPTHWCPFSDRVSPLSPDPQPTTTTKMHNLSIKADLTNTNTNTNTKHKHRPMSRSNLGTPSSGKARSSKALSDRFA